MKFYHKNRLLKLADLLDTVPETKFNLKEWVLDKQLGISEDVNKIKECGYAGCAVGWATTIPSFRKAGLRLYYKGSHYVQYKEEKHPISAASKFFNISEFDARDIFADWTNMYGAKAINEVCRKIEKLVKEYHP